MGSHRTHIWSVVDTPYNKNCINLKLKVPHVTGKDNFIFCSNGSFKATTAGAGTFCSNSTVEISNPS